MKIMVADTIKVRPEVISETGHALLGPSSAERWLTCTPSARLSEAIPDKSSVYADEGSAAHAAAEARLAWLLGDKSPAAKLKYQTRIKQIKKDYESLINDWTTADWEAIDSYVQYVIEEAKRIQALGGSPDQTMVGLEAVVDFSKYVPYGSGTTDAVIWNKAVGVVKVIDLKFGKGVPVDARGNPQARLYALGTALGIFEEEEIERVARGTKIEWAIVQPRLDYIGEDSSTVAELLAWAEGYVAPRAALAWAGEGELNPSEKACRFCKVAPTCRARFDMMSKLALEEFMQEDGETLKDTRALTPAEIGELLPKIDGWIRWAKSIQDRALGMARDEGIPIPGHKLVRGRTSRVWTGTELSVIDALTSVGIDRDEIMEPETLKSVAQVEKSLGKRLYTEKVAPLVVTKQGALTLVEESDKREAVILVDEARAEFGVEFEEVAE